MLKSFASVRTAVRDFFACSHDNMKRNVLESYQVLPHFVENAS